jgi:protein SCO1/2
MTVNVVPRSTFVRRYLMVMSVLILAAVLATLAMRAGVRARSSETSAAVGVASIAPTDALPVLGEAGEYSLIDQTGTAFSSASLLGKVYVIDFIFTSCTSVCPVMSASMARVHQEFAAEPRVAFVSVTVDPATDKPEVLDGYAKRLSADPARWHFLTGEDAAIQSLARDRFKLGQADKPINHTTRFVLVDGAGKIRGYYFGTEAASVAALGKDIERLLRETSL